MEAQEMDRVRAHTDSHINDKLDQEGRQRIERLAGSNREEISRHMNELDREWDIERYLETNAAVLSLTGVVLGATVSRKFLVIPAIVFPFLLQHSLQGWCPPLPVFRRLGVRTKKEIGRERYALKALRGDFEGISAAGQDSLQGS